jgi:hypothetical protein
VPVPAGVLADLVVVQAGFALGCLEVFLDGPAGAGHAHEFGQGHPRRCVADEVDQIPGAGQGPAGGEPVLAFGIVGTVDGSSWLVGN